MRFANRVMQMIERGKKKKLQLRLIFSEIWAVNVQKSGGGICGGSFFLFYFYLVIF